MGLLRKAARASARTVTKSLSPEASLSGEDAGGAGLLRKSLRILASGKILPAAVEPAAKAPAEPAFTPSPAPAAEPAEPGVEEITKRILDDLGSLSDGVEFPSRLFTALKKHLSISKGALLLFDPSRLEYAPWSSCGYDQTTLHRLRIALGANETFNALANGRPLSVTSLEQKGLFQRFFSSREFSTVDRLLFAPFIHEETLAGVLLITELKAPFTGEEKLLACLAQISEETSPHVQKARARISRVEGPPKARRAAESPEEQINRLLTSPAARGKKFLFASLTLAAYCERIASSHEDLDQFRLSEDVRYYLDSFLADLGSAIMLAPNVFLVCLQELPKESLDLFVHQLGLFLGSLFGTSTPGTTDGIVVTKSRIWPDEGSDVRELVSFLSS